MILPPRGGHDRTHKRAYFFERDVLVACSPDLTAPSARKSDGAPWTARAAWSVESESSAAHPHAGCENERVREVQVALGVWGARAAGRGIERVYFAKMHEYKPSNDGAS